jgi:hypothetical protein
VWSQRITEAHSDYVPETGHLPFVEQPAWTAIKILTFLERRP